MGMKAQPIIDGILSMSLAERRHWAEMRGNPFWLWPEVSIPFWQRALHEIANVLTARLTNCAAPFLSGNPLALSLAAYSSGTGPLLGSWIEEGWLATDDLAGATFLGHLGANRARMVTLGDAANGAFASLAGAGVPTIILKGMDTAYSLFDDPAARPMADIDILVPAAAREEAVEAIALRSDAAGWGETTLRPPGQQLEPLSLFRLEADDPWSIDLHHKLDYLVLRPDLVARLDRAVPFQNSCFHPLFHDAQVLTEPLRLLHLTVHASGGLHSLTLLRQYEIVAAIRRGEQSGALDWSRFIALAEHCEALGFTYPAFAMAEKLAPRTVPPPILARARRRCPPRAVTLVDKLSPATVHRVARQSLTEHFMWSAGVMGHLRQIVADLHPAATWQETITIFRRRFWQAARGVPSR